MASGGFGREMFGDPLGGGGPISVVRAWAVAGQVVRVVFSGQPLHRSPAGTNDALNPSNYLFSVATGQGTAPTPVGVDTAPIVGPARAVATGEYGLDVHVDRQLVEGVTYRVMVKQIGAASGGAIGSPYAADFPGVTRLQATQLPERRQDLVDVLNPPDAGHWIVDDSGDLTTEGSDSGLRKRSFRRLTTRRGAFSHIPLYGLAVPLKGVGNVSQLNALRVDAINQLKMEPEVGAVAATTSLGADGVTMIQVQIRTRRGNLVPVGLRVSPDGTAAVA